MFPDPPSPARLSKGLAGSPNISDSRRKCSAFSREAPVRFGSVRLRFGDGTVQAVANVGP